MFTEVDDQTYDGVWHGTSNDDGFVHLEFVKENGDVEEEFSVTFTTEQFTTFRALVAVL